MATARPVGTSARSPGASSTRSHEERSIPASPAYARAGTIAFARSLRTGSSITTAGLGEEERSKTRQVAPGQARDQEDAVLGVLALLDRRAERVELGEPAALVVRDEQPNALPAIVEPAGEPGAEL